MYENIYFDVLDRLGVDHECDGRTDRQTEWPLAIARSSITRDKKHKLHTTTNRSMHQLCAGL